MEEPDGDETYPAKGVLSNLLVRGQASVAVVVDAFDNQDAGVDRHDHGQDQDSDANPST